MKYKSTIYLISFILIFYPVSVFSGTWSLMASGVTNDLDCVWGSSVSDVFAVGIDNIHYNGSAWSDMTFPESVMWNTIYAMWGSSGSDLFAVGDLGTILHYDGSTWSDMTNGAITTHNLYGVWGSSGSDVFAVGDLGTILHFDGSSWAAMSQPLSGTTTYLYGVWGSSGSDVFTVGTGGTILHYDGSTWSTMTSDTPASLRGVWGSSGSDVFTVGSGGKIMHYDGSSWSDMTNPLSGTKQHLNGVWGSSGSDVFAAGNSGTILHFDGSSWSSMTSETTNNLTGVWGSSGSDAFAVGDSGTILHYGETISTTTVPVTTITTTTPVSTTTTTLVSTTTTTQVSTTTTTQVSTTTTTAVSISTTIPSTSTTAIIEAELKADFIRDKVSSGPPPLVIQFTDMSSGNITSYAWDFGDNETSTEKNPAHTYLAEGTYDVSLTVKGNGGEVNEETKYGYITVKYNDNSPTTTTIHKTATTTTTVPEAGGCPAIAVLGKRLQDLNRLRALRNEILLKTPAGQFYTVLYYRHAFELRDIFAHNNELKEKANMLMQSIMPVVGSLLAKREAIIDEDTVWESIALIDALTAQASPALEQDLIQLKQNIQNGVIFDIFGIKIQKN
jgi:PKD repeat protein